MGLLNRIEEKGKANSAESAAATDAIVTDIDRMQAIVAKHGSMGLKDIAVILKADAKRVEELARILDKHGIAELYYPPVGEPLLRKTGTAGPQRNAFKKPPLLVTMGILLLIAIAVIAVLKIYGVL
ncbi:hypothetical protein HYU10_05215 [Candidatus Woesearchaeota archaeon]|nr:hypothetical protein [Candidatus Woesearchaeota archaeon]MBI2131138.1 hypothetical protein [Candidatus Woesearchaeota archaeon]